MYGILLIAVGVSIIYLSHQKAKRRHLELLGGNRVPAVVIAFEDTVDNITGLNGPPAPVYQYKDIHGEKVTHKSTNIYLTEQLRVGDTCIFSLDDEEFIQIGSEVPRYLTALMFWFIGASLIFTGTIMLWNKYFG